VRRTARYGWRPDLPDVRDFLYKPSAAVTLPPALDLRSAFPPVYDQGDLGSCTGNAIAGIVQFLRMKESLTNFTPSRLMIYYDERVIEGTVGQDAGAEIRDGISSMNTTGACDEALWPYDISQFTVKPPATAYAAALKDRALQYERIDNTQLDMMKQCLADGFPFVFGFTVYESFESDAVATSGIVPMPAPSEQVIGGHAVCAVGYDDGDDTFLVRNSWGSGWGQSGYCQMPYAYLSDENLTDDCWKISLVSAA
jgi:C1A family cysteine protease